MTTATAAPTTDARAPTMKDVEKQEIALADIREKLAHHRSEEARLAREVVEALAAGEDARDLQTERIDARELAADLQAAERVLAERLRTTERAALRGLAEERLRTLAKKSGGLAGELPRRLAKAEELVEALTGEAVGQLTWLYAAPARAALYQKEADILAARFGLEVPEMRGLPADLHKTLGRLRVAVHGLRPPVPEGVSLRIGGQISKGDLLAAARTIEGHLDKLSGETSPTPGIIERAGPEG